MIVTVTVDSSTHDLHGHFGVNATRAAQRMFYDRDVLATSGSQSDDVQILTQKQLNHK
jgi:hypothetical protein